MHKNLRHIEVLLAAFIFAQVMFSQSHDEICSLASVDAMCSSHHVQRVNQGGSTVMTSPPEDLGLPRPTVRHGAYTANHPWLKTHTTTLRMPWRDQLKLVTSSDWRFYFMKRTWMGRTVSFEKLRFFQKHSLLAILNDTDVYYKEHSWTNFDCKQTMT